MASKEISIWIDQHWYDALSKHLKDETLEEHLENVVDEMCNQLPRAEYERVSTIIWQEEQQAKQAQEAARRFAVYHVTEGGVSTYLLAEQHIEMIHAALQLRNHMRRPESNSADRFTGRIPKAHEISKEEFDACVAERMENTGRVTGAFDIDLDKGTFDAVNIMDGWQSFRVQDVSTAVYFAMKKTFADWSERWRVFLDRLDGKQITLDSEAVYLSGNRTLQAEDISFADDVLQNDNLLEFYMETSFDADSVFGTHVCAPDCEDYINIYASYDMEARCVSDTLLVYMVCADGFEEEYKYRLNDEERELLLPKMEEYCQHRLGQSLEECCADFDDGQQQTSQGMQM